MFFCKYYGENDKKPLRGPVQMFVGSLFHNLKEQDNGKSLRDDIPCSRGKVGGLKGLIESE